MDWIRKVQKAAARAFGSITMVLNLRLVILQELNGFCWSKLLNMQLQLNGYRGDIGSTQNQVESAVRNLMTQSTNIKAAESVIRDVDYAEESANFNKLNIISQAGSYAISQSNATQQNVLRLFNSSETLCHLLSWD